MGDQHLSEIENAVARGIKTAMGGLWGIDMDDPQQLRDKQKDLDYLSTQRKNEETTRLKKQIAGALVIFTLIGQAVWSLFESKITGG